MNWLSNLFKKNGNDLLTSEVSNRNLQQGHKCFEDGLKLYLKKDYINAVHYLDKAIELRFYNDAFIYRGCCLRELEYYSDAIEDFNKAISISPKDCNIYYDRSLTKSSMMDFKGAVEDLKTAIELSKLKTSFNKEHNKTAIDMGFTDITEFYKMRLIGEEAMLAVQEKEKAKRLATGESEIKFHSTKRRLPDKSKITDNSKAFVELDKLSIDIDKVKTYYATGMRKITLEDFSGAIIDFMKAIEIQPMFVEGHIGIANAKFKIKDYEGAIVYCNRILEIKPGLPEIYYNRGLAKDNVKDYEGAIIDFDKAIELNLGDEAVYLSRGVAKYSLKDYKGAIADYTKAIEFNSANGNVYFNRGIANLQLSQKERGRLDLEKAKELGQPQAQSIIDKYCQ